ncbi:MAG: ATP-dependent DNA helicase [Deltaproteobacteria bacterium]|nr:MAG: ATP-dependent DNA helicase [Deltaproteobacteria bacterium]
MAEAVARALREERHLVVEAGTGTGKTLGYLVPALLSGRRILVSTATRALQEQIARHDLPRLAHALDRPVDAALLKGRSNYVCDLRLMRLKAQPALAGGIEEAALHRVERWLGVTETGDRAECHDLPEAWPGWQEIVSTSETCIGSACEAHARCFVMKARARAEAAQIVIVNHHLFFADLALRTSAAGVLAGAAILAPYEAVIFDEAHTVEDLATHFFGHRLSSRSLEGLARDAQRFSERCPGGGRGLARAGERLLGRAQRFFEALPVGTGRWRLEPEALAAAGQDHEAVAEALSVLADLCAPVAEMGNEEAAALGRRALLAREALALFTLQPDPGLVYWAERRPRSLSLHASPIDVAEILRERLLADVPCVFTSATLSVAGRLDYFLGRIGLDPGSEVETRILDSPFDFSAQAALYLPEDLPPPGSGSHARAVAEETRELAELTLGRAFVLCTSLRNMAAIHRHLASASLPWPLYVQGEAPKAVLLDRFRAVPGILVATQSFWEGVDVPGDALSLVVIDKLPFQAPDDPVVAARIEYLGARGVSPFSAYQLPRAALALKQGFGRLIRSRRDRGIVTVCDARLRTRSYGRYFLETLPPCPSFHSRDALRTWWQGGGASTRLGADRCSSMPHNGS